MATHLEVVAKRLFFCSARNKDRLRGCSLGSDRFRRLELAAPPSHAWPFRPPTARWRRQRSVGGHAGTWALLWDLRDESAHGVDANFGCAWADTAPCSARNIGSRLDSMPLPATLNDLSIIRRKIVHELLSIRLDIV